MLYWANGIRKGINVMRELAAAHEQKNKWMHGVDDGVLHSK